MNKAVWILAFGAALAIQGFSCLVNVRRIAPEWERVVSFASSGDPQAAAVWLFQVIGVLAFTVGLLSVRHAIQLWLRDREANDHPVWA